MFMSVDLPCRVACAGHRAMLVEKATTSPPNYVQLVRATFSPRFLNKAQLSPNKLSASLPKNIHQDHDTSSALTVLH